MTKIQTLTCLIKTCDGKYVMQVMAEVGRQVVRLQGVDSRTLSLAIEHHPPNLCR